MTLKDWRRMKTQSPKWETKSRTHSGGKNRIELEKTGSVLGGDRWFVMHTKLDTFGFPKGFKGLVNMKGGEKFKKHALQDARQYMKNHKI